MTLDEIEKLAMQAQDHNCTGDENCDGRFPDWSLCSVKELGDAMSKLIAVARSAQSLVAVMDLDTLPGRGLDAFANLGEHLVYVEGALKDLEG